MKTSDKIKNPTFGNDNPVLVSHEFLFAMSSEVAKLEEASHPSEIYHIMRRAGTGVAVEKGLAISAFLINALISSYLDDGWVIQSTHLIGVAKPQRKRWWEFWKTSDRHEQDYLMFDFLWVLVR